MTGVGRQRVYLDWNASAPLRPEARAAMLAAMDVAGNPSSVHAEGRAARAIVEKARGQVAALVGCQPDEVVFTSGATEAANAVLNSGWDVIITGQLEHESTWEAWKAIAQRGVSFPWWPLGVAEQGFYDAHDFDEVWDEMGADEHLAKNRTLVAFHAVNGETGVWQPVVEADELRARKPLAIHCDATQAIGKYRWAEANYHYDFTSCSAHKFGGPKGAGALVCKMNVDVAPLLRGGGQEKGGRSGTENVVGIAGFGAAAEAAQRDLENGVWEPVEKLRDELEHRLESAASDLIIFGKGVPRLPNTSCFAVPGWAGETQVMAMDLAGFAVSAGSACSSGKVKKASRVLMAMGFDEETASSAIRVSMGPTTTRAEVMAFADAWTEACRRRRSRAA